MIFSGTALLAITVVLLFGTTIAAPVPTDRSTVDFSRHNLVHQQLLSGGTSIMDPLEPRGDTKPKPPKKIYNSNTVEESNRAIAVCENANRKWGRIMNTDSELTAEADRQIATNNAAILELSQWQRDHHFKAFEDKQVDAEASFTTAKTRRKSANDSLKAADVILKEQKKKADEERRLRREKDDRIYRQMKGESSH